MKRNIIIGLLLATIGLASVTWIILKNRPASSKAATDTSLSVQRERTPGKGLGKHLEAQALNGSNDDTQTATSTSAVRRAIRPPNALDFVDDDNLSDVDKQQLVKLQDALDDEDLKGVRDAAQQLMRSQSEAVRVRTAAALGWFGAAALPDLVEMLGDSSADVVETTLSATLDAIAELDDGPEKAELLAAVIATLNDTEALEEALMHFAGIDDEIVIPYLEKLIEMSKANPVKSDILTKFLAFTRGGFSF